MAAAGSALQVLAVLVCLAGMARPAPPLGRLTEAEYQSYHDIDHQGPGTYAFGYDVDDAKTGNTQFRQEERHPNGTVTGSYGFVDPDGTVRVVHYVADHLGYRVTIENTHKTRRLPIVPPQTLVQQKQAYQQPPVWQANPFIQPVPYSANYI